MDAELYVGNMSVDMTEDTIRELFTKAGTVTSVTVVKDRSTGTSRGFGFVVMSSRSEMQEAIKTLNGYTFGDRQLSVNMARPREERGRFQNRSGSHKRGGGRRY